MPEFNVDVYDQETVNEIARVPLDAQRAYLSEALRIGVLALRTARGEVDAAAIKTQVTAMLAELAQRLAKHVTTLTQEVREAARVEVARGSVDHREATLRFMEQLVGAERAHAEMARKTLDEFLGPAAPVRRWLAPESAENVYAQLSRVNEQLLQTFVAQVKRDVVGQFSLDDKASALSRLNALVVETQRSTLAQLSLDDPESAISRLSLSLHAQVFSLRKEQETFHVEVRAALAVLAARKEERAVTTSHGLTFEQAVTARLVAHANMYGDAAENVGETTGMIRSCKVGDVVITMGAETGAPGARIVIEAKAAQGYALERILEESKLALDNRKACVALFVLSSQYETRPNSMPVERFGNVIIVRWNHESADTDIFMTAAVSVARAMAVAQERSRAGSKVDVPAVERAVANVSKKLEDLEDITTWATTIGSNAEKIVTRVRTTRAQVAKDLETLVTAVEALR